MEGRVTPDPARRPSCAPLRWRSSFPPCVALPSKRRGEKDTTGGGVNVFSGGCKPLARAADFRFESTGRSSGAPRRRHQRQLRQARRPRLRRPPLVHARHAGLPRVVVGPPPRASRGSTTDRRGTGQNLIAIVFLCRLVAGSHGSPDRHVT